MIKALMRHKYFWHIAITIFIIIVILLFVVYS